MFWLLVFSLLWVEVWGARGLGLGFMGRERGLGAKVGLLGFRNSRGSESFLGEIGRAGFWGAGRGLGGALDHFLNS